MKQADFVDISWPISPAMTAYKDRNVVDFQPTKMFENDGARETRIVLTTHTGTHVDAPSHMLKDGKTIEQILLPSLIGPCQVFDMTHCTDSIDIDDVSALPLSEDQRILFKTRNSLLPATAPFNPSFVYLSKGAAEFLAQKKIAAVGVDYLGIERNQPQHETHMLLFGAGCTIIEGLRLGAVDPGQYFLCCLPLPLQGLDAAPCLALLFKNH